MNIDEKLLEFGCENLKELYRHKTALEIAKQFDCSVYTIYKYIDKWEIKDEKKHRSYIDKRNRFLLEIPRDELIQLYQKYGSIEAVAKHFDRDPTTITLIFHKKDIPMIKGGKQKGRSYYVWNKNQTKDTDERLKKMSEARQGKGPSEETSEKIKNTIIDMYANGKLVHWTKTRTDAKEISAMIGKKSGATLKKKYEDGFVSPVKDMSLSKYTKEDFLKFLEEYKSINNLAKFFGCSIYVVRLKLREFNIKVKCGPKFHESPWKNKTEKQIKLITQKIGNTIRGTKQSEENKQKKKISLKKYYKNHPEALIEIAKRSKDKHPSFETKQRMSITQKEQFKNGRKMAYSLSFFRKDLGHHCDSSWEANYCRVLKYLGFPYLFHNKRFTAYKDGKIFGTYFPDVQPHIENPNGFVEIKGHAKSADDWGCDCLTCKKQREKIELIQKQFPYIKINIFGEKEYRNLRSIYKSQISEWEKDSC